MRLENLKILLIDDNPHMRTLLGEILRAVGGRDILQASDGAQGLKVLKAHEIDIVITDLAMAPMDGIAFLKELRTSPGSPNPLVPVIMITGHSTQARVAEARDAGVNEFLTKPITAAGVLERVRRVIDNAPLYVRSRDYFGPDRRHRKDPKYRGPLRRSEDGAGVVEV